jgi:hypothetical protein
MRSVIYCDRPFNDDIDGESAIGPQSEELLRDAG